mmetsp:Transcript_11300/g.30417  ORF Transcript_11300/g.30417 Transcript_11300/m.30417 type:complete len:87 (+) Transcript_11300:1410-1670(+)
MRRADGDEWHHRRRTSAPMCSQKYALELERGSHNVLLDTVFKVRNACDRSASSVCSASLREQDLLNQKRSLGLCLLHVEVPSELSV